MGNIFKFDFNEEVFAKFHSSNIDTKELENIIGDAVKQEHPLDSVKNIRYTKEGVIVILDSGQEIDIEIDWNEIILS